MPEPFFISDPEGRNVHRVRWAERTLNLFGLTQDTRYILTQPPEAQLSDLLTNFAHSAMSVVFECTKLSDVPNSSTGRRPKKRVDSSSASVCDELVRQRGLTAHSFAYTALACRF